MQSEGAAGEDSRRRRVRDAIVHYVRLRPGVSDTALGIVQWWLPAAGVEATVELVESVLDELVEMKVLRRTVLPDGGLVYAAAWPDGRPRGQE